MMFYRFLDPKNEVAFRKVFGSEEHKDVLIHFLNDILNTHDRAAIQEVKFLSPIKDPEVSWRQQSIVDVLCTAQNGEQVIVEMQVAPNHGFEKHAQYYAAKAYLPQLHKGQGEDGQYPNLKEVIFIAISDTIFLPNTLEYKSDNVVFAKNSYEHDLKGFSFTFLELPKFKKDDVSLLSNMLEKWCFFFKHADEISAKNVRRLIGSDLVIESAYDALDPFNWTEQELFAYEQEIKRIWDYRATMAYQFNAGLSKGISEGISQGRAEGILQGRAEDKTEGRDTTQRECAIKLLESGVAIKIIASSTGLSEEELHKISQTLHD